MLILGLSQVLVDYVGDATVIIDPFDLGTNETVNVRFEASCCVRKATLKVLDVAGNGNQESLDQGPLTGAKTVRLFANGMSTRIFFRLWKTFCG